MIRFYQRKRTTISNVEQSLKRPQVTQSLLQTMFAYKPSALRVIAWSWLRNGPQDWQMPTEADCSPNLSIIRDVSQRSHRILGQKGDCSPGITLEQYMQGWLWCAGEKTELGKEGLPRQVRWSRHHWEYEGSILTNWVGHLKLYQVFEKSNLAWLWRKEACSNLNNCKKNVFQHLIPLNCF